MAEQFKNSLDNPTSTLASGITAIATTMTVAAGQGSRFPSSGDFRVKLTDAADDSLYELVKVTARATDTLTIERAAESANGGGAARAFNAADLVDLVLSAKAVQDLADSVGSLPATYQPLDSDLTAIAGLTPTNDDVLQRKAGAWANRTMVQFGVDIGAVGTIAAPLKFTGVPYFGPAAYDGSGLVVMTDANAAAGVIQWVNNASVSGEMIHLAGGPLNVGSGGSGPTLLAIGVNYGGVGCFINNYTTGVGLKITNRSTVSNAAAWGFLLSQNSDVSEGMYLSQETATAKMPLKIVSAPIGAVGGAGAAAGQILTAWYRSQAATFDTLLASMAVDAFNLTMPIISTSRIEAQQILAKATGANIEIYDTGGTANQRRWKWSQTVGILILSQRNDADASTGDLLYFTQAKNMGLAGFNSFGSGTGGLIGLPNATATPSGTPSGGGVLYVTGGALTYKGSSGTITTVAPA